MIYECCAIYHLNLASELLTYVGSIKIDLLKPGYVLEAFRANSTENADKMGKVGYFQSEQG